MLLFPFDLEIPGKTSVCISGPSGSGKSTFIRLFNRMILPDTGEMMYKDKSLSDREVTACRRKMSIVFQEPVIFSGTVEQNLIMPFQMK